MPTRYLKPGIRDSAHIEALSGEPDAEILYCRLIVSVDDFGRTDARPLMIKSLCFPIRVRATADKCMQWLQVLEYAGLIQLYSIGGKEFLQIKRWDNKPRSERSKFPDPPPVSDADADTCIQLSANVARNLNRNRNLNRELEPELKQHPYVGKTNGTDYLEEAKRVLEYLNKSADRNYRPVASNLKMIVARLKSGATPEQMREVVFRKCQQWEKDEKMAEYLRPATLFNATKFEQYLGELLQ